MVVDGGAFDHEWDVVGDAVGGCGLCGGGGNGEDFSEWSVWVGLVGECVVERGDSWCVDAVVVGEEDVHAFHAERVGGWIGVLSVGLVVGLAVGFGVQGRTEGGEVVGLVGVETRSASDGGGVERLADLVLGSGGDGAF